MIESLTSLVHFTRKLTYCEILVYMQRENTFTLLLESTIIQQDIKSISSCYPLALGSTVMYDQNVDHSLQ
jgi:hypothetical protein